jgi:hypothetical protein
VLNRVLVSRRHVLVIIAALCATVGVLVFPGAATRALATQVSPPPVAGPTGLPDGRIYEQVSPLFKNGNFVEGKEFGLASADGNSVLYVMNGAAGTASAGIVNEFVSRHTPTGGWETTATTPRPTSRSFTIFDSPLTMVPSVDFERFLFTSEAPFVREDPGSGQTPSGVNIFLSEGPFAEPAWLGKPQIAAPLPALGGVSVENYFVVGQSPDLDTVYFTFIGTLTPEDAGRAPNVALGYQGGTSPASRRTNPGGFYEWHEGRLVSAGALPDGSFNPFGAVPAAWAGMLGIKSGYNDQAEDMDNEVSEDGSRAFFVSPDPSASTVTNPTGCAAEPPCSSEAPELYIREPGPGGTKVSVLVSASHLPGHEGEGALDGVVSRSITSSSPNSGGATDIYASPDGLHAFFASRDRLTATAPDNEQVKEYEYEVASGALTYVPINGPIVTVAHDGSEVLFEDSSSEPSVLKLWRGPGEGSVTAIAELPSVGKRLNVNNGHIDSDDQAVVFRTNATIPRGFNDGGGFEQIYRYELAADNLDCLSCAPIGIAPSGDAHMSYNNTESESSVEKSNGFNADPLTTLESRGISTDGSRVFFDTPSALVPQDVNGASDVYEWENGVVYLISSGENPEGSIYLDNSSSGNDVFFSSGEALSVEDTDGSPDVYDARVPRSGETPPPSVVPCKGSVCQGPANVPQLLGSPSSESFGGAGNVASPAKVVPKAKIKIKVKKAKRKRRRRKKAKGKKANSVRRPAAKVVHRKGRGN